MEDDDACYKIFLEDLKKETELQKETGKVMHSRICNCGNCPTLDTASSAVMCKPKSHKRVMELRKKSDMISALMLQGEYLEDGTWTPVKRVKVDASI